MGRSILDGEVLLDEGADEPQQADMRSSPAWKYTPHCARVNAPLCKATRASHSASRPVQPRGASWPARSGNGRGAVCRRCADGQPRRPRGTAKVRARSAAHQGRAVGHIHARSSLSVAEAAPDRRTIKRRRVIVHGDRQRERERASGVCRRDRRPPSRRSAWPIFRPGSSSRAYSTPPKFLGTVLAVRVSVQTQRVTGRQRAHPTVASSVVARIESDDEVRLGNCSRHEARGDAFHP